MRPVLLPLAERLGRRALHQRGVRSRWVETKEGWLHVYDAPGSTENGALPTVVILHGLSSSATPFGPVLLRLRRHVRRVVAPDYPGHGFSDHARPLSPAALFDSVNAVLESLEVEPAILVGNSLGGAIALHVATERPERVRALVLVSPAGAHSTNDEWSELRRRFDLRSRRDGLVFARRLYHHPPRTLALFAHELPAMVSRPAVRELMDGASNDVFPTKEAIASLPMPILLLWGKDERLLPESHYEFFAQSLPKHAVIERPETYAHCPHFDQPADLAARIVAFAREHIGP